MKVVAGILLAIVIIIAVNAVVQTNQVATDKTKQKSKLSVVSGGLSGAGAVGAGVLGKGGW